MVGPTSSGKASCWKTLQRALEIVHDTKIVSYVIDPKAINKEELYGSLDPTTLEWTNGVFTAILRKIIDNVRGEDSKQHWIVFDGDVDPEWAENLNSVLDDNKLLTLPNGERLALSPNIRIFFETQNLDHATLATVSRCGMVWFNPMVVTADMMLAHSLMQLANDPIPGVQASINNRWKHVQTEVAQILCPFFGLEGVAADESSAGKLSQNSSKRKTAAGNGRSNNSNSNSKRGNGANGAKDNLLLFHPVGASEGSFVQKALAYVEQQTHVMSFTRMGVLTSMSALLKGGIGKVMEHNDNPNNYPIQGDALTQLITRYLVYAVLWGFGGSMSLKQRIEFCRQLHALTSIPLPEHSADSPLLDYYVKLETGEWDLYENKIDSLDLEPQQIIHPDVVIDTVDTARHVDVLGCWLQDHRPLILCGPPGSGPCL